MSQPEDTICFVTYSAANRTVSYTYRVWARGTSFYLKVRNLPGGLKISAHGPDLRYARPGFKLGIDGSTLDQAHENTLWRFEGETLGWFSGAPAGRHSRHLVRVRVPWSVMQRGAKSGPLPTLAKKARHAKLEAPRIMSACDVDIYLSDNGQPYWPDQHAVERDNSGMGPLFNTAGQALTAVCTHRSMWRDPMTAELEERTKGYTGSLGRTLAVQKDPTGFIWICERLLPQSFLRLHSAEEIRALNNGGATSAQ
ncbi:hypothetical protein HUO13_03885 [Saccharopolyspora erythraea]|uniref:hypothetical protein n=1 Tax=Saccharopolyspora erythraea TaxID=1836 RepID=UPI001BAC0A1A|nr:hypothetical protein [Saccharopolyspora erythraea]QUH00065.1 hypothetical protein HUO13_03885 [Saccharopolyspora erythraea]